MPRRSGRLSEGPDRRGLTQLGKSNVMADPQNDKVLSADQRIATIARLNDALRQLFAVVENYPDLKANQNFLALQQELANTEDRLQTSRRFYNANVRD